MDKHKKEIEFQENIPRKKSVQIILDSLRFFLSISIVIITVMVVYFLVPGNIYYSVTERYQFSTLDKDADVFLGVLLPISNSYQKVSSLEFNWPGTEDVENLPFVDVAKFSGHINVGEQIEAVINYNVSNRVGGVFWKAPIMDFQILPQQGIESDDPKIKEAAKKITEKDSLNAIYQIYMFTINRFAKPRNLETDLGLSALEAYLTGSGACLECSRMMVAFSRANEIPSQVIIGNIYPEFGQKSQFTKDDYGHAWVEFYANGFWSIADPGMGNRFYPQLYFLRNDGIHVSYGEIGEELEAYRSIFDWTMSSGNLVKTKNAFMRYAVSSSEKVVVGSQITIDRKWDGRLMNTAIAWAVITYIMLKNQYKYIHKYKQ